MAAAPAARAPVHALPEAEFMDHLREMGGTPAAVLADAELMAALLPAVRADYEVYETYTYSPGPPLTCALTALGGEADPHTDAAALPA